MRQDLVDATPGHDVAGQKQSDRGAIPRTARNHVRAPTSSGGDASTLLPPRELHWQDDYIEPKIGLLSTVNAVSLTFSAILRLFNAQAGLVRWPNRANCGFALIDGLLPEEHKRCTSTS
jgi:hypothetical protein